LGATSEAADKGSPGQWAGNSTSPPDREWKVGVEKTLHVGARPPTRRGGPPRRLLIAANAPRPTTHVAAGS
jgi:hypothetical protein